MELSRYMIDTVYLPMHQWVEIFLPYLPVEKTPFALSLIDRASRSPIPDNDIFCPQCECKIQRDYNELCACSFEVKMRNIYQSLRKSVSAECDKYLLMSNTPAADICGAFLETISYCSPNAPIDISQCLIKTARTTISAIADDLFISPYNSLYPTGDIADDTVSILTYCVPVEAAHRICVAEKDALKILERENSKDPFRFLYATKK